MRNITKTIDTSREKLPGIKYLPGLMWCIVGISLTVMAAPADLDPTFGSVGKVVSSPDGSQQLLGLATALQPDGKIVMAGTRLVGSTYSGFVVARYNANGSPDTNFGNNGWNSVTFGAGYEYAPSVAVQPDGKIVVGGTIRNIVNNMPHNEIAVIRFNPDGSLDTGFDGDGKLIVDFDTNLGSLYQEYLSVIKVASDGKIVVFLPITTATAERMSRSGERRTESGICCNRRRAFARRSLARAAIFPCPEISTVTGELI